MFWNAKHLRLSPCSRPFGSRQQCGRRSPSSRPPRSVGHQGHTGGGGGRKRVSSLLFGFRQRPTCGFGHSPSAHLHVFHQVLVEVVVSLVNGVGDGPVPEGEDLLPLFKKLFRRRRKKFRVNTYDFRLVASTGLSVLLCVSCSRTKLGRKKKKGKSVCVALTS